jgi:hypothetical protein
VDRIVVPVSDSAYAPEPLDVKVGLYDYWLLQECPECPTRMTAGADGDAFTVGEVALTPLDERAEVPNPVRFNFGGEMALVGYAVEPRSAQAGEAITVRLYWEALREMSENYTVSVQVLRGDQRVAQSDSWPQGGDAPTAAWQPGEVVEDAISLQVSEQAAAGEYTVQVVVYALNEAGNVERLQRITPEGRLIDDFLLLTRVRIGP